MAIAGLPGGTTVRMGPYTAVLRIFNIPPSPADNKGMELEILPRFRKALALGCLLLVSFAQPLAAQENAGEVALRCVRALRPDSDVAAQDKVDSIAFLEKNYADSNSSLVTNALFNACNANMEREPRVREAAARALGNVCNLQDIMYVHRLARVASPASEPEPAVRMAALQSLARSNRSLAASAVRESAKANGDPDPEVRRYAQKLIEENPQLLQ